MRYQAALRPEEARILQIAPVKVNLALHFYCCYFHQSRMQPQMLGEHGIIWQSWGVRDVEDAAERQLIYAFFYFYLLLAVFSYF